MTKTIKFQTIENGYQLMFIITTIPEILQAGTCLYSDDHNSRKESADLLYVADV